MANLFVSLLTKSFDLKKMATAPTTRLGAAPTAPREAALIRPTVPTTQLSEVTFFAPEAVKRLRDDDFALGSKELVSLKYEDCILVLFYGENVESKHMARLWAEAAAQVAGPIFAAVNVFSERKVAEAFNKLNSDPNHPLHWAAMRQLPFSLVYRKGWPQAFYNGQRSVETFVDYALTLACVANYQEHQQLFAGEEVENKFEMTAVAPTPLRTVSTQFTAGNPMRQYNPAYPPVIRGSAEEQQEIASILQSRGAAPTAVGAPPPGGRPPTAAAPAATGIPIAGTTPVGAPGAPVR